MFRFLLLFFLIPSFAFASVEIDEDEHGVEVSAEAIKNYGIEVSKIDGSSQFYIARASVVLAQDKYFIYKTDKDMDHFEEVQIFPKKFENGFFAVEEGIKNGEMIATKGTPYLRMIFLDSRNKNATHVH